MIYVELLLAAVAIAAGGVLKGATGAGAPVVGVPILALIFDVRYAVAVFAVVNLFTNLTQWWQYRRSWLPGAFLWLFAAGGAAGALAGSYMLAFLPQETLLICVGVLVVIYILFRLAKPDWKLPFETGVLLALPAGVLGGVLQGVSGISATVSLTFLNALHLARPQFIATISAFFTVMSVLQIPALAGLGILTWERFAHGLVALALVLMAMPIGSKLAERVPKYVFDRLILALLAAIAAKILLTPLF